MERLPRIAVLAQDYDVNHSQLAETFIQWMNGEQMLPQTVDQLVEKYAAGLAAIVLAFKNGVWQIGSQAVATKFYPSVKKNGEVINNGAYEVGAVVTNPDLRRQGLALQAILFLTKHMEAQHPDLTPLAFTNPKSMPVFSALNWQLMPWEHVHHDALCECANCPMKATLPNNVLCCDIPMWKTKQ